MKNNKPPFIEKDDKSFNTTSFIEPDKENFELDIFIESVNLSNTKTLKQLIENTKAKNYLRNSLIFIQFKINTSNFFINFLTSYFNDDTQITNYSTYNHSLNKIEKLIRNKCISNPDKKYIFIVEALREQDGIKSFLNKLSALLSSNCILWLCSFTHKASEVLIKHFDIHVIFSASATDLELILSIYPIGVAKHIKSIQEINDATTDEKAILFFRSNNSRLNFIRPNPISVSIHNLPPKKPIFIPRLQ